MNRIPTPYTLNLPGGGSAGYYRTIAAFTDCWQADARTALARPVTSFLQWQSAQKGQSTFTPSFDEAAFEMLVLGVLLREHGAEAISMPQIPGAVLAWLVDTQDRMPVPQVERPMKAMRGFLQGLSQPEADPDAGPVDTLPFRGGAAPLVGRLVDWLQAGGLGAQADHMALWRDYLACLDEQRAQAILARCLLLADDFAEQAEAALGQYTRGVNEFIADVIDGPDSPFARDCRARWRYDSGLITRTPVEYHLGMLGTEVLTRAYRYRYMAAPRKIVIVPDCLCARSRRVEAADTTDHAKCQAELTSLGYKCAGCTPGCRVRQITGLGEKRGFEAYILPDDLRGVGLSSCSKLQGAGVVGVSCALTNWDAGWMVHDAGVPAQGVLLDYAGCKNHWHEQGVTTDVNLEQLLSVVEGK